MYLVTNRNLRPRAKPERRFGKRFNDAGPDELRLAEARRVGGGWKLEVLDDEVDHGGEPMLASEHAFLQLQDRMRRRRKHALFFVHGFNNDLEDVLKRARGLERNYGVEVIAFTWPANGRVAGGTDYRSDKRDAVRSAAALDRALEKLHGYFLKYQLPCGQRISLFLHSMGNYLVKHLMMSSIYQGETELFDNTILVAPDVNNEGHAEWLDRIAVRRRLYVTVNEDDRALQASRLKFGKKQRARLGHSTQGLNSRHAVYLDFTRARHVGDGHSYFEGEIIRRNHKVKEVFRRMIHGERAEVDLAYDPHTRTYLVP